VVGLVLCLLFGLPLFAATGLAVEGAGHAEGQGEPHGAATHESGHDAAQLRDLLYRFINFALLVIILVLVLRKAAVKDFFSNRAAEIKRRLEELRNEKDASENRYKELERKLRDFEARKQEIIEQYRAEGNAEKEKIIQEARERAEQMLAQADQAIQREVQGAVERLKQEVVEAAAQKAQEIISRDISDSDQERLVNEFIERVGKVN
jgi:F-type H+-transporting ATPase subunit b